jgi:hypothetical protein
MLKASTTNSNSMEIIGRKPILSGVDLHVSCADYQLNCHYFRVNFICFPTLES